MCNGALRRQRRYYRQSNILIVNYGLPFNCGISSASIYVGKVNGEESSPSKDANACGLPI